jgi:hypothetical protein
MKLNLITRIAIFDKVTKLQFVQLDHIWCKSSQSGLTYSIKIEIKDIKQETLRVNNIVPNGPSLEKEETKNE